MRSTRAAHGFHAQGERNHVQQQQIARRVVARQLVGLNGGAQSHHFVRVEVVQRRAAKEVGHRRLHLRHAGGAADHDHALHVLWRQTGIAQHLAHGGDGADGQLGGGGSNWLRFTSNSMLALVNTA
jgi:hypothetical protein